MRKFPDDFINKVICGDCLEVMKEIPDKSVDLVITSPPYKNAYEGIGISKGKKTAKYHYSCDVGEPLYAIIDASLLIKKVLNERGIFLLNLGWNKDSGALRPFYIINRILKQGWFCPENIIWHKKNPIPNTASQLTNAYEYLFMLTKIPTYNFSKKERQYIHNVWDITIGQGKDSHSAVFPNELPRRCIELFSSVGDIILDPFAGLGTTLVEAKKLNRKFIGIDISSRYCKTVKERLRQEVFKL